MNSAGIIRFPVANNSGWLFVGKWNRNICKCKICLTLLALDSDLVLTDIAAASLGNAVFRLDVSIHRQAYEFSQLP
jgi:hypothetical protein